MPVRIHRADIKALFLLPLNASVTEAWVPDGEKGERDLSISAFKV